MQLKTLNFCALFSCIVFWFGQKSWATTATLPETTEAYANDSNNDGAWDTLFPGPRSDLLAYNGVGSTIFDYNYRAAVQFDVSSIPQNATISSATLLMQLDIGTGNGRPNNSLQFNGYVGTGTIALSDFTIQNPLAMVSSLKPADGTEIYKIPAIAFVQSLVAASDRYAGFTMENIQENQTALDGESSQDPPELQITYTVPEPSAIVVLMFAPLMMSGRRLRFGSQVMNRSSR